MHTTDALRKVAMLAEIKFLDSADMCTKKPICAQTHPPELTPNAKAMVMYTLQSIASSAWLLFMQPMSSMAAAVRIAAGLQQ